MRPGAGSTAGKGSAAVGEITAIGELVGEARGAAARVSVATSKAQSYAIVGVLAAAVLAGFLIAGIFIALGGLAGALSQVMSLAAAQMVVGVGAVLLFATAAAMAARRYWPKQKNI